MRGEHTEHGDVRPARRQGDVARSAQRTERALLEHRIAALEAELEERDRQLQAVIDHYEGLLAEAHAEPNEENEESTFLQLRSLLGAV